MNSDKKISVVVVDDEEEARNILERQLMSFDDIKIIGKASGADPALDIIMNQSPDILFLDIQMPGKDGFTLVEDLRRYLVNTTVIFVTAYSQYAIHALKVAAFDYLLKPVVFEELKEILYRYRTEKRMESAGKKIDHLIETLNAVNKLKFNTRSGYILVAPHNIIYCEADVNYSWLHMGKDRKEIVTVNIGKIEEILADYNFYRVSRSVLINIAYLTEVDRKSRTCLLTKNNESFPIYIPPNHIRELEKFMGS